MNYLDTHLYHIIHSLMHLLFDMKDMNVYVCMYLMMALENTFFFVYNFLICSINGIRNAVVK